MHLKVADEEKPAYRAFLVGRAPENQRVRPVDEVPSSFMIRASLGAGS